MIVSTNATAESKRCSKCTKVKPITEFHRKRKGSEERRSLCVECKKQGERDRCQRTKFKRDGNAVAEGNRELRAAVTIGQVQFLIGEQIGRFGGLAGFMDAWVLQNEAALKQNLGGRRGSSVFEAIANVYALCRDRNGVDLTGLSVAESAEVLAAGLLKLHKQHPKDCVEGMQKGGWPGAQQSWTH